MNDHPITPPPELVEQWDEEGTNMFRPAYQTHLTTQAARWGADQELEACCEWLRQDPATHDLVGREARYLDFDLRAARRPNPPSLKEQALEALDRMDQLSNAEDQYTIRRALEALDD